MSSLENYMTREELASELGISPRTLDRWAVARTGPPRTKCGPKKVLYDRRQIEAWLQSHTEEVEG